MRIPTNTVPKYLHVEVPDGGGQFALETFPEDSSRHFVALDGLRGVAIAMVLYWHFIATHMLAPANTFSGYLYKLTHHSYSGVDLFFVLSGFLITRILLKEIGTHRWLARFWIRRTFRILPIYFLFLAASFTIAIVSSGQQEVYSELPETLWPYFFMLQNFQMAAAGEFGPWGHLWSLGIEEQFYLLFPFALLIPGARNNLPRLAIATVVLSTVLRIHRGGFAAFVLPQCRLDGLAVGVCVGFLSLDVKSWSWIQRNPAIIRGFTLLGLASLAAITLRAQQRHLIDHTVFAISYGVIVLEVAAFPSSLLSGVLSVRPLVFLGIISYPLYMFHGICEWLIRGKVAGNHPLGVCLAFAAIVTPASILVAWAINRWFGDPFLAWGKRWASQLKYSPHSMRIGASEIDCPRGGE